MRILVTGGAGFIGSNLVDRLLTDNHEVICLDNFNDYYDPSLKHRNTTSALLNLNYHLIVGDIRDPQLLDSIFTSFHIELVVHLAACAGVRPSIINPQLYYDVNLFGTLCLLESMKKNGVRKLIFASSSSVYGNSHEVPFSEEINVNNPISPYAASKKAAELLCHTYFHLYGFDIFCLRFFTVYGPRQRPEMAISLFTKNISLGLPIKQFGNGSSKRDYTFISDIIDGILAAIIYVKGFEIINLGESQPVSLKDLIQILESCLNHKATITNQQFQSGDVDITYADISKARKILNYKPIVSIKKGLEIFVEWYNQTSI
jgi:UDP-glucuronate 4-epimerase